MALFIIRLTIKIHPFPLMANKATGFMQAVGAPGNFMTCNKFNNSGFILGASLLGANNLQSDPFALIIQPQICGAGIRMPASPQVLLIAQNIGDIA